MHLLNENRRSSHFNERFYYPKIMADPNNNNTTTIYSSPYTLIGFMLKTTSKNKYCSLSIKEVLEKSNSENKFQTFYQGIDTYF